MVTEFVIDQMNLLIVFLTSIENITYYYFVSFFV